MLEASVRRRVSLAGYLLGLGSGAAVTSALCVTIGTLVNSVTQIRSVVSLCVLAVGSILLVVREAGIWNFPLPENKRLVPESVFRFGPFLGSMQFGIEMGSGVRTFVTSTVPYFLLVSIVVYPTLFGGVTAAFGFAAGRYVMTVSSIFYGDVTAWVVSFDRDSAWKVAAVAVALASAAEIAL